MGNYRTWWRVGGGLLGALLLSFAAFNYCRCYCSGQVALTLSAGNVCPLRGQLAEQIAERMRGEIDVALCKGTNSEAICAAVDSGKLDLGLVLGGLEASRFANVRQAATLGVEPLHLLVRRQLAEESLEPSLDLLKGKRVALGEPKSNGARLAEDLLSLAGLHGPASAGGVDAEYLGEAAVMELINAWQSASGDAKRQLEQRLPDGVFLVDAVPSPAVDLLVAQGDYQLVPLPYASALHVDARRGHRRGGLQESRVEATKIPAFAYGIRPPAPASDCETVGLQLILIANRDVPSDAVRDLLRLIADASKDGMGTSLELEVRNANSEFPVHPGAEEFLRTRRPINLGEILGPTTDALSVVGAAIAGGLAMWGFIRSLRSVQPDVHLRQIDRIERLLQGDERDDAAPTLPLEFLAFLEARLAAIKQAAIEDYAAGRLDGDDALVGILTLVADTRHLLALRRKQLLAAGSSASGRHAA